MWRGLLLAVLVAGSASVAANGWRSLPWHLVDLWWTVEGDTGFREFSIEVEIEGKVDGPTPLYIAPTGLLVVNGVRAYGGLQTEVDLTGQGKARGIIFSRWGERDLEHARTVPGGVRISSGSEGDFISVRNRMDWQAGRYRIRVTREDAAGEDASWLTYSVCRLPAETCTKAGSLKFPGGALRLGRSFNSFFEVYGRRAEASDIPPVTVTYRDPRLDGVPVRLRQISANYPGNVPPYAKAVGVAGGARVETGRPFDHSALPVTAKGVRHEKVQFASH